MENDPSGRTRKFSDADLREDLQNGLKPGEIAAKHAVSGAAVYKRIRQLELTTTSAVVAPVESQRFVNQHLNLLDEIADCLRQAKRLLAAYESDLQDPDDPAKLNIGPRAHEVIVTYWEKGDCDEDDEEGTPKMVKAKAALSDLLRRIDDAGILTIGAQSKFADPRVEFRNTLAEIRQIVTTCVDLSRQLADARAMQQFREAMLAEIGKVSPDVAQAIAAAVRSVLVLHAATD